MCRATHFPQISTLLISHKFLCILLPSPFNSQYFQLSLVNSSIIYWSYRCVTDVHYNVTNTWLFLFSLLLICCLIPMLSVRTRWIASFLELVENRLWWHGPPHGCPMCAHRNGYFFGCCVECSTQFIKTTQLIMCINLPYP